MLVSSWLQSLQFALQCAMHSYQLQFEQMSHACGSVDDSVQGYRLRQPPQPRDKACMQSKPQPASLTAHTSMLTFRAAAASAAPS